MSYNDSYFGEPAGLLKSVVAELARAVDPIYPEPKPKADPLAGVTVYTATVEHSAPFDASQQNPPAEPAARAQVGALGFARPAELDDVRRNKDSHAAIAIFLQPEKSDAHSVPIYTHPSPAHAGAGDAEALARKIFEAHREQYRRTPLWPMNTWEECEQSTRDHWTNIARRLAGGDRA